MYDHTKLVSKRVWDRLVKILPTPRQKRLGRKKCNKEALLNGILQVLVNGVSWGKIAFCGCSYVSCFRYFQELQRRGILKLIYKALSRVKTDLSLGSIDTTTITSFEFQRGVGWNGKDRVVGTKLSLFADKKGQPADIVFGKGNNDDRSFLPQHCKNTVGKRKKILNLDMMYMGLTIRRDFRRKGIRINMKVRDQDYRRKRGPKFSFNAQIYNLRFLVERLNGWLKNFRRLRMRRDYNLAMFKAFVYLCLIIILMRY